MSMCVCVSVSCLFGKVGTPQEAYKAFCGSLLLRLPVAFNQTNPRDEECLQAPRANIHPQMVHEKAEEFNGILVQHAS